MKRNSILVLALFSAYTASTWAGGIIATVGGPLETSFDKQTKSTTLSLPLGFGATGGGPTPIAEVQSRLFKGTLTTMFAGEKPATTIDSFMLVLSHAAKGQASTSLTFTIDGKTTVVRTTLRDEVGGSQLIIATLPRSLVKDLAAAAAKRLNMKLTANGFECYIVNSTPFDALLAATASAS